MNGTLTFSEEEARLVFTLLAREIAICKDMAVDPKYPDDVRFTANGKADLALGVAIAIAKGLP